MQLFVKIIGFLLILSATTLFGFYKAQRLVKREKRLFEVYLCLNDLRERIRLDGGEIYGLLQESFNGKEFAEFSKDGKINFKGFNSEETELLYEYLENAGMSDTAAECDRAELYAALFLKQHSAAKKRAEELCRLYREMGFMSGLFICIFLM